MLCGHVIEPGRQAIQEPTMRVLSATIGALLISVSHVALAQAQDAPQGDAPPAASQCEVRSDDLPQMQSTQMTAEDLVAQLPERPLGQQREVQPSETSADEVAAQHEAEPAEITAEELVAQLPEAPLARQRGVEPAELTAEDVVAQLPEAPLAGQREEESAELTAEDLVAQLPDRPLAGRREVQPAEMTVKDFVAQLPDRPLGGQREVQSSETTAEELVAQLPERRLGGQREMQTAEDLVAQLPDRPLAKRREMRPAEITAEQLVAQLPEAPLDDMQDGEKRQPEAMKAEMQQDQPVQTEMPRDPQWAAVNEPKLGTTVDVPRGVFSTTDGHAVKQVGRRYKTPDGRAKVAIWTQRNTRHDTPSSYLHRTFNIPRASVDYERSTADFAVVSGLFGTKVYYLRCNYSPRSGSFHCFDLAYPAREKQLWDGVVTRMSRSLRVSSEPRVAISATP
jgi:hypothetical protein